MQENSLLFEKDIFYWNKYILYMLAAVLKKPGDVSNLIIKNVDAPKTMTKNDLYINHTHIGANIDDCLMRKGLIDISGDKNGILGFDGVGIIEKVGSGVTKFKAGQRVAYGFGPMGAYCEKRVINANFCVSVPEDITSEMACAMLRKGLVAHTLLFRCHLPRKTDIIMITGVGSGVGNILARWAKFSGLKIIGVIGSDSKKDIAFSAGCDIVINYNDKDAIKKISDFTNGVGVNVVYDAIGKATYDLCIQSLHIFGTFISFGNASGNIPLIDPLLIESKSLFITKPRFELYKSNRNELVLSAYEVFDAIKKGAITTNVARYQFNSISNAHRDIETKKTNGSVILSL